MYRSRAGKRVYSSVLRMAGKSVGTKRPVSYDDYEVLLGNPQWAIPQLFRYYDVLKTANLICLEYLHFLLG